jgi:hypothetical protein
MLNNHGQSEIVPINIPIEQIEAHYEPNPDLMVVHLNKEEAKLLDEMQGGLMEDPDFGIRSYEKLSQILENKDVRELLIEILRDLSIHGKPGPVIQQKYNEVKHPMGKFHDTDGDEQDYVEDIAEEGNKGDTELALLPMDFADFWDMCRGYTSTNRKSGLREYFGFLKKAAQFISRPVTGALNAAGKVVGAPKLGNEMLRVAAPIIGYVYGGPMGAALGSGFAHLGTGNNLAQSGLHGLKSFGMAHAANYMFPQTMGSITGGIGSQLPTFGGALAPGAAAAGVGGAGATGAAAANAAGAGAGAAGSAAGASGAGATGASSLLDKLTSPAALLAAGAGAMYLGHNKAKKDKDKDKHETDAKIEENRRRYGMDTPLREPIDIYDAPSYDEYDPQRPGADYQWLKQTRSFKKGGNVSAKDEHLLAELSNLVTHRETYKGKTKGQADKIPSDPPQGSYIWDASVTSMLGDGNTEAGSDVIHALEDHVLKNYKGPTIEKKLKIVPAMVSDGEVQSSPLFVTLLGNGSNAKGASFLKKTIEKIRHHKSLNKGGLPPKIKPIEHYFPYKPKILGGKDA